jgi:hypothetical protein
MGALFSLGYDFKHVGALVEIRGNARKAQLLGIMLPGVVSRLRPAATDFFLAANAVTKKKVERRLTR